MTTQRVHPAIGDPEEFIRDMELFRTSRAFAKRHHVELLEEYPDEWIGIYDGKLCAHDRDIYRMLAQLDQLGVPRGSTFTKYLESHPVPKIL